MYKQHMSNNVQNNYNECLQCVELRDHNDRLGTHLILYISTILVAIKNNYKIMFIKPKTEYRYYKSIFVTLLFDFIEEYNKTNFGDAQEGKKTITYQGNYYFPKIIRSVLNIKCDFVTAFKECVFTQKFGEKFQELAKIRNYTIPYNSEKTIVVHLRLDDRKNRFIDEETRKQYSMNFKNIIDAGDTNYKFPGYKGQSAIKEDEIQKTIERALKMHEGCEVIIITNGKHNLPYKTITNADESYDLFLLCNSKVFIGSMSTFSFAAIMFGNHEAVYYPIWDHAVCFGLTTKYDKTENIMIF